MSKHVIWIAGLCSLVCGHALTQPALRVLRTETGTELLRNGDFKRLGSDRLAGWRLGQGGVSQVDSQGRFESRSIACESLSTTNLFGASQNITLNRTNPIPLIVRGWSKA